MSSAASCSGADSACTPLAVFRSVIIPILALGLNTACLVTGRSGHARQLEMFESYARAPVERSDASLSSHPPHHLCLLLHALSRRDTLSSICLVTNRLRRGRLKTASG